MASLAQTHLALLERFRKTMNLVGPGPVQVHFDDCRLALNGLTPTGHWVDLGSGAGFPGLVLAAQWPTLSVDLVDSRQKRCIFLQQVLREAGEGPERVRVLRQRVEDSDGPYDGVVARAFAPPPAVVEHGARLLRSGGLLVLFLQDDGVVPEHPSFEVFHVERYEVEGKRRKTVTLKRL